jgi:hypothetical protein
MHAARTVTARSFYKIMGGGMKTFPKHAAEAAILLLEGGNKFEKLTTYPYQDSGMRVGHDADEGDYAFAEDYNRRVHSRFMEQSIRYLATNFNANELRDLLKENEKVEKEAADIRERRHRLMEEEYSLRGRENELRTQRRFY